MSENFSHVTPKELVAFTLVYDEYLESGDILKGVMPLFVPILSNSKGELFDPESFSGQIQNTYDIPMSTLAAKGLASKMLSAGLLVHDKKTKGSRAGFYRVNPNISLTDKKNKNAEKIEIIVEDFIKHAKKMYKSLRLSFDEKELEKQFLQRFTNIHFLGFLKNPERTFDFGEQETQENTLELIRQNESYVFDLIISDFVSNLISYDNTKIDVLLKLAEGALIADLVLVLQQKPEIKDLEGTICLLDAPILLDLLDLNSPEDKKYADQLVKSLYELKFKICIYDHCIEEMEGIVQATVNSMHNNTEAYGALANRMNNDKSHAAYATACLNDMSSRARKEGIEIIQAKKYESLYHLSICEEEVLDTIRNRLGTDADNFPRREKVARSVVTTIRMREKSKHPKRIDDANVIFITQNFRFQRSAVLALKACALYDDGDIPPIVTDQKLAGLLWYVSGGNVGNLTKIKLISNCSSVLHPEGSAISAMKNALSDIDEQKVDVFSALMKNKEARQYFSVRSLELPCINDDAGYEELLDDIKAATAKEISVQKGKEQSILVSQYDKKVEVLNTQIYDLEDIQIQNCLDSANNVFNALKILIILIFGALIFFVSNYKLDSTLLSAVVSALTSMFAFWIVPDFIFNSLCKRAWEHTFSTNINKNLPALDVSKIKAEPGDKVFKRSHN